LKHNQSLHLKFNPFKNEKFLKNVQLFCDISTSVHLYKLPTLITQYEQQVSANLLPVCIPAYNRIRFWSKKVAGKISQPAVGNNRKRTKEALLPVWHYACEQQNGFSFK